MRATGAAHPARAAAAIAVVGAPLAPARPGAGRRRCAGRSGPAPAAAPRPGPVTPARAALALVLAFGLGACAFPTREAYDAQMAALVGRSEAELVGALGVPVRTHEAGGLRFLEYERRRVVGTPAGGAGFGRFGYPYGYGYGAGFGYGGTFVDTRECSTTFTLRGGRVERFSRRGDDCRAYPSGGALP